MSQPGCDDCATCDYKSSGKTIISSFSADHKLRSQFAEPCVKPTTAIKEEVMKVLLAVVMVAALTASTMALPVKSDAKAERLDLLREAAVLQRLLNNLKAGEGKSWSHLHANNCVLFLES